MNCTFRNMMQEICKSKTKIKPDLINDKLWDIMNESTLVSANTQKRKSSVPSHNECG